MQAAGNYGTNIYVDPGMQITPAPAPTSSTVSGVPPITNTADDAAANPAYTPSSMQLADIYKDPTVQAFLRASGLSEQTAANDVARRQAAINTALNTNLDDLAAQGDIARRNIAGNQEARGVYRSGQTLQRTAEQQAAQARQQSALQQNALNQVNDLSGQLAQQVANNQQRAAELGTTAYINNALAAGKAGIDSTYSNDAGAGNDNTSFSDSGAGSGSNG